MRLKKKSKKRLQSFILWVLLIFILIYNPITARLITVIVAISHNLDSGIFYKMVETESSFNSFALSRNKAKGLGQVKSSTAQYIYPNYISGMLWFPPTNLHIAAIYYKYLLQKYKGNHSLSLAAYNWGESNVDRKVREEKIIIEPDKNYRELFRNVPETYYYIKSVLGE